MLDAERLSRVERLYVRVLDSPPERRTAVLEQSCSGDPELLHELTFLCHPHAIRAYPIAKLLITLSDRGEVI